MYCSKLYDLPSHVSLHTAKPESFISDNLKHNVLPSERESIANPDQSSILLKSGNVEITIPQIYIDPSIKTESQDSLDRNITVQQFFGKNPGLKKGNNTNSPSNESKSEKISSKNWKYDFFQSGTRSQAELSISSVLLKSGSIEIIMPKVPVDPSIDVGSGYDKYLSPVKLSVPFNNAKGLAHNVAIRQFFGNTANVNLTLGIESFANIKSLEDKIYAYNIDNFSIARPFISNISTSKLSFGLMAHPPFQLAFKNIEANCFSGINASIYKTTMILNDNAFHGQVSLKANYSSLVNKNVNAKDFFEKEKQFESQLLTAYSIVAGVYLKMSSYVSVSISIYSQDMIFNQKTIKLYGSNNKENYLLVPTGKMSFSVGISFPS